jgi:hypothetical protein
VSGSSAGVPEGKVVREEPSTPDLHEVALESVYNSGNVGNPSRETGVTIQVHQCPRFCQTSTKLILPVTGLGIIVERVSQNEARGVPPAYDKWRWLNRCAPQGRCCADYLTS